MGEKNMTVSGSTGGHGWFPGCTSVCHTAGTATATWWSPTQRLETACWVVGCGVVLLVGSDASSEHADVASRAEHAATTTDAHERWLDILMW